MNELSIEWIMKTGQSLDDLTPGFLDWRTAYWEFCDLVGEVVIGSASTAALKPAEQLAFWIAWLKELRGIDATATAFCIKQINKLRGK